MKDLDLRTFSHIRSAMRENDMVIQVVVWIWTSCMNRIWINSNVTQSYEKLVDYRITILVFSVNI